MSFIVQHNLKKHPFDKKQDLKIIQKCKIMSGGHTERRPMNI